jgi:hypothetical protein
MSFFSLQQNKGPPESPFAVIFKLFFSLLKMFISIMCFDLNISSFSVSTLAILKFFISFLLFSPKPATTQLTLVKVNISDLLKLNGSIFCNFFDKVIIPKSCFTFLLSFFACLYS